MRKILVTGNEGYIGRILVEKLKNRGFFVVGLDSGIFSDVRFTEIKEFPDLQLYKDIRDVDEKDLEGIDAVIHLAGLSNDPVGLLNPELTYEINYKASVRLAEKAKKAKVSRFLFSSSCSSYGISNKEFVDENGQLNPQTPYAISKIKTEEDVSRLGDKNFSPIFLRNSTVFGISPRMRLDLVVQNLLAYAFLTGKITILSDGSPWRPLVHVKDVADAFCFFLESPREKVHNQKINIGHRENNVQVKTIAKMIKDVIPEAIIDIRNENPSDNRSYKVDFSKQYNLGFAPQFSVMDGIKEIYSVFKERPLTKEDFESDKYITLRRYQELLKSSQMDKNLRIVKR